MSASSHKSDDFYDVSVRQDRFIVKPFGDNLAIALHCHTAWLISRIGQDCRNGAALQILFLAIDLNQLQPSFSSKKSRTKETTPVVVYPFVRLLPYTLLLLYHGADYHVKTHKKWVS